VNQQTWAAKTKQAYIYWFKRWGPGNDTTPDVIQLFMNTYPFAPVRGMLLAYSEWSLRPELRPKKLKGRPPKRMIRWLERDEVTAFIRYAEANGYPEEGLMIRLLFEGGLRIHELLGLKPSDLDFQKGTIRFIGKGNKEAIVRMTGGTARLLADWVKRKGKDEETRIFCLKPSAAWGRLTRISMKAFEKKINPHALRHSLATYLNDTGVDIKKNMAYMRIERMSTMEKYLHTRPADVERAVMDRLEGETGMKGVNEK